MENTRECFRVTFPLQDRPVLKVEDKEYPVLNLSEKGGLFLTDEELVLGPDMKISGVMNLHEGRVLFIEGTVLRRFENKFVICFSKGVPFGVILNEQRYLLKRNKYI